MVGIPRVEKVEFWIAEFILSNTSLKFGAVSGYEACCFVHDICFGWLRKVRFGNENNLERLRFIFIKHLLLSKSTIKYSYLLLFIKDTPDFRWWIYDADNGWRGRLRLLWQTFMLLPRRHHHVYRRHRAFSSWTFLLLLL